MRVNLPRTPSSLKCPREKLSWKAELNLTQQIVETFFFKWQSAVEKDIQLLCHVLQKCILAKFIVIVLKNVKGIIKVNYYYLQTQNFKQFVNKAIFKRLLVLSLVGFARFKRGGDSKLFSHFIKFQYFVHKKMNKS